MDKYVNPYQHSMVHSLASFLACMYLTLVGITNRVLWRNRETVDNLEKKGQNHIYAMWHARQIPLIYTHKNRKICVLVSRSRDGEYMTRILRRFGLSVVRGSTSKGGPQAILELIDSAASGFHPAMTPDGPRGPGRNVQQGIIYLAQKTSMPIVPVACGMSRKLVLRSWDEFQVPLPLGKTAVVYGNPVYVSKNDSLKSKSLELQKSLDSVTLQADKLVT